MPESTSSLMAIMFGLAVFTLIVAVGWRSVQNRRILRLKGADGQETIIVAREDDEISSIVTTAETAQHADPEVVAVPVAVPVEEGPAQKFGRAATKRAARDNAASLEAEADSAAPGRLSRVVASTR